MIFENIVKVIRGIVKLRGGTDNTVIGNNGDKLKVDGSGVTQPISGSVSVSNFPATQNVAITSSVELEVKNDSGNPLPISAASLPLPTGAATAANQATEIASLASIDAGIPAALGQTTMASSMPVVIASNQSAIPISGTVTSNIGTITDTSKGREYTGFSPDQGSYPGVVSEVSLDFSDNLMTRGQVLTDEGSFRDDFTGSSLTRALSGNIQWGSNDASVQGTGGSLFTTEVRTGNYIKKTSDSETAFTQVDFISDDSHLTLTQGYLGTNGTSSGVVSNWKTFTPTGGSLTVSNSILSIASGTANANVAGINREGDYLPYNLQGKLNLSQRIANQTTFFGFQNNITTPTIQACFVFDGTDNTKVKTRSSISSASADTQETTVTLPVGNTSTNHTYSIDLTPTQSVFSIDGVIVAVHQDHLPGPYDNLEINLVIKNSALVTSTTVAADYIFFANVDQVEVTDGFASEYFRTKPADPSSTYSASIMGLVPAATATDVFTITGSATKAVKIKRIEVSGTQTTGGTVNIVVLKRSTANTGGTSTSPAAVPHDSNNAAATATINAYTANPTVGTLIGNMRIAKIFLSGLTAVSEDIFYDFGYPRLDQEITLRGTSQVLSINLNSTTITGGNLDISIEWVEE